MAFLSCILRHDVKDRTERRAILSDPLSAQAAGEIPALDPPGRAEVALVSLMSRCDATKGGAMPGNV